MSFYQLIVSPVRLVGRVKKAVRRAALRGNNDRNTGLITLIDHPQLGVLSELSWLLYSTIRISSASTVPG